MPHDEPHDDGNDIQDAVVNAFFFVALLASSVLIWVQSGHWMALGAAALAGYTARGAIETGGSVIYQRRYLHAEGDSER